MPPLLLMPDGRGSSLPRIQLDREPGLEREAPLPGVGSFGAAWRELEK